MNYGQIIFHLEDYYNYGGIISTTTEGIKNVEPAAPIKISDTEYDMPEQDNSINIYKELVPTGIHWTKIGIQAPAGTKFELNGKPFVIGPSGLYELSNVIITDLKFIPLAEYELNASATETYLKDGKELMQNAIVSYSNQIIGLNLNDTNTPAYKAQTEEYIAAYENGYNLYQVGLNGIYEPKGYQIQKNIIIDYKEEKRVEEVVTQ